MVIWHVAPLRFAPAFRALGVCEHIWLRCRNFDPSCFDPIQKFGMSTWGLTLIFDPVPSTYFRPPMLCMHARPHRRKDGNRTFRQKKPRDVPANFSCRNVLYYLVWFSTNWLGPVWKIPVCRFLELKNDKTINVGMMQSIKRASDMSSFFLVLRGPLGPLMFPSC